jgi:proteasome alpha subunit
MGGDAERISAALRERWAEGLELRDAVRLAVDLLASGADSAAGSAGGSAAGNGAEQPRVLTPAQLEVAVLDRDRPRRKFRRLQGAALADLLGVEDDSDVEPLGGQ